MKTSHLLAAAAAMLSVPAFAQTASPATGAPGGSNPTAPGETSGTTTGAAATAQQPAAGATGAATATAGTAKVTVGAQVADAQGGAVGTIESVDGDYAVLSTGATKARLPVSSFAQGPNGLVISMTKQQLEQAASGAAQSSTADAKAQVTVGAKVSDTKGGSVGTVEAVEGEFATVATSTSKVKLPLTAFGAGASGPVIAMTAAELDAAAKAAAPAAKPSGGR